MTAQADNQVKLPPGYFDGIMSMIRSKLATEIIRPHVDECLSDYVSCLFPNTDQSKRICHCLNESQMPYEELKRLLKSCTWIKPWFNIDKDFWSKQSGANPRECIVNFITALHGCWIFLLDDARNTFAFPIFDDRDPKYVPVYFGDGIDYKAALKRELHLALGRDYTLRPGQGSVGLGLRADASVCLRDTVRDVRGSVALEDCLMRNLSYIGIPVHGLAALDETNNVKDNAYYERRLKSRPNGHFGLFFPAVGAWHEDMVEQAGFRRCCHGRSGCASTKNSTACGQTGSPGACLHREVEKFAEQTITPIVEELYRQIQLQTFQIKSTAMAELGENQEFTNVEPDQHSRTARRRLFLETLVTPADAKGRAFGDFLAVEGAQLWERKPSEDMTSSTEEWICQSVWRGGETFLAQLSSDSAALLNIQSHSDRNINELMFANDSNSGPKPPLSWRILSKNILGHKNSHRNVFESLSFGSQGEMSLLMINFGSRDQYHHEIKDALNSYWMEVDDLADHPNPARDWSQHPEYLHQHGDEIDVLHRFSRRIREVKWRRLVYGHAARLLAGAIVHNGGEGKARLRPSKYVVVSDDRNRKWTSSLVSIARIVRKLSCKIDAVWIHRQRPWDKDVTSDDCSHILGEEDRERLELEVNSPATMRVLETVAECWAEAVSKSEIVLPASLIIRSIPERGCRSSDVWGHTLLQSDWVPLTNTKNTEMVDCGTLTAIGIPSLWSLWTASRMDGLSVEQIEVVYQKQNKKNKVDICLRTNRQQVVMKVTFVKYLASGSGQCSRHNLLDLEIAESPVFKEMHLPYRSAYTVSNDSVEIDPESMQSVADFMTRLDTHCGNLRPKNAEGQPEGSVSPLIARVGDSWRRKRCDFRGKPCPLSKSLSDEMKAAGRCDMFHRHESLNIARRLISMAYSQGGWLDNHEDFSDALGLRTHSIMPLYRPGNQKECLGVLVLSGSQQENDSIDRVSVRQDQQALLKFASDYLEYAITQERGAAERIAAVAKVSAASTHEMVNYLYPIDIKQAARAAVAFFVDDPLKWGERTSELINSVSIQAYDEACVRAKCFVDALDKAFRLKKEPPVSTDNVMHTMSHIWRDVVESSRFSTTCLALALRYDHDIACMQISGTDEPGRVPVIAWRSIFTELLRNALKYCAVNWVQLQRGIKPDIVAEYDGKKFSSVHASIQRYGDCITIKVVNTIYGGFIVPSSRTMRITHDSINSRLLGCRGPLLEQNASYADFSSGRGSALVRQFLRANYPHIKDDPGTVVMSDNDIPVYVWSVSLTAKGGVCSE
jgi:signal transduction histidine kinase